MLAVCLSPFYVAWNIVQLMWILRWMQECHGVFRSVAVRTAVVLIYALLATSLLTAFFLPPSKLQRAAKLVSNYWLGVLLYMTLVIGAALILRLILMRVPFAHREVLFGRAGFIAAGGVCTLLVAALSIWGIVGARTLRVTQYQVTVDKACAPFAEKPMRIVLAADLHLGYNIGNGYMRRMTEKINEQDADLVVIAGDIFDNEYEALEDPQELAEILGGIKSRYGVYACYGNHDIEEPILAGFTFGGKEKKESDPRMDALLEAADIRLLRDEAVLLDDAFYVYGRPDYSRPGRGIDRRKTAQEITRDLDLSKPVIVLDHEPRELDELSGAGADIDLCGHTHDGQMFPANILVSFLWENSCGYLKKGTMHNIVTSGVGVFGPFMRVGTRSEICVIDVAFSE